MKSLTIQIASTVSSFTDKPWTARTFLFREKPLSGSALPCGNKRTQWQSLAIVLYFIFPSQSLMWDTRKKETIAYVIN